MGSTSAGIALWAAAVDRQADRELLNPPESARTYSGEGEASEAGAKLSNPYRKKLVKEGENTPNMPLPLEIRQKNAQEVKEDKK